MHSKLSFLDIVRQTPREKIAFGFGLRAQKDLAAWEEWKEKGDQASLEKLFKRMDGLIESHVNQWASQRVPRSALRAEAEKLAMQAFNTFNPDLGNLATHTTHRLRKLYSFAAQHGNIAKVPEKRWGGMQRFNEAERYLRDKLNREPSAFELANEMALPISEIERYRKENIKILGEGHGSDFSQITAMDSTKAYALMAVYYGDLTRDEKIVFEYLKGMMGKPKETSTGKIAKMTGLSPSKVSRLKKSIADKVEKYL